MPFERLGMDQNYLRLKDVQSIRSRYLKLQGSVAVWSPWQSTILTHTELRISDQCCSRLQSLAADFQSLFPPCACKVAFNQYEMNPFPAKNGWFSTKRCFLVPLAPKFGSSTERVNSLSSKLCLCDSSLPSSSSLSALKGYHHPITRTGWWLGLAH